MEPEAVEEKTGLTAPRSSPKVRRSKKVQAEDNEDGETNPRSSQEGLGKKPRQWKQTKPIKHDRIPSEGLSPRAVETAPDASDGANMGPSSDISGTLEYLRRWTVDQDLVNRQDAQHRRRMESMMQLLLQNSGDGGIGAAPDVPDVEEWPAKQNNCEMQVWPAKPRQDGVVSVGFDDADEDIFEADPDLIRQASRREEQARQRGEDVGYEGEKSLGRLHSVFVQAIWRLPTHDHEDHRKWHFKALEHFVESPRFEALAACFMIAHAIFIGASVEYLATAGSEKHTFFIVGNIIFVIGFCLEVGVKAVAERQEFFLGSEWRWNVFDVALIATVFVEIIMGIVLTGKDEGQKKSMKTFLKMAEMVRTIRILRIFRVLKFSICLRVIVAKILTSAKSLVWIMLLFALLLYVVAVCITQGYNDYLDGEQHAVGVDNLTGNKKAMNEHFGSVPRSAFTLFASTAGGVQWSEISSVLEEVHFFYSGMFVCFIALSLIAVMNLITGIFVDDAIRSDQDIIMDAEAKEKALQVDHLTRMFNHMDKDASDQISLAEFMAFANDPILSAYLKALNISPDEAETLFTLLDEDGSGHIQIAEFLAGCMHLRGEATSLDMKTLLYETRRLRRRVFTFVEEQRRFVDSTRDRLAAIEQICISSPKLVKGVSSPKHVKQSSS